MQTKGMAGGTETQKSGIGLSPARADPQQRADIRSERAAGSDRLYNILNIYIHRT